MGNEHRPKKPEYMCIGGEYKDFETKMDRQLDTAMNINI